MAVEGSAHEFPAFPFEPYTIQLQFMRAVYEAIEKGGVAIVESPTGTGKTLSLICSVLQWRLNQNKQQECSSQNPEELKQEQQRLLSERNESGDEPDWMSNFVQKEEPTREANGKTKSWVMKCANDKHGRRKDYVGQTEMSRSARKDTTDPSRINDDESRSSGFAESCLEDSEFLIEEYYSDEDERLKHKRMLEVSTSSSDDDSEMKEDENPLTIFFCSRTHSQLAQFIGELKRTTFSSTLKVASLGSRKSLCNNPDVANLGSSFRINDRCLELQRTKLSKKTGQVKLDSQRNRKETKTTGCPMLRKQKLQRQFQLEVAQARAPDIEDLISLGNKIGTCPYYGILRAIPGADLVVLPYQYLLHRGTRESVGLRLKNSVVVIDEAQNLIDTVSSIHSCMVTGTQLKEVSSQLSEYLERFRSRLAASNRRYIQTLLILINSFLQMLCDFKTTIVCSQDRKHFSKSPHATIDHSENPEKVIMSINDFVFSLEIDNINLVKLHRYIKESNIVHKVSSYGEREAKHSIGTNPFMRSREKILQGDGDHSSTGFYALAEFVLALTNADKDGRVLVVPNGDKRNSVESTDGYLKFTMLNAAKHFLEVLQEARAVVLAGGTLQPVEELRVRLFPHLHEELIHIFSCGHIVPSDSVLPIAIGRGPSNLVFDFTFQSRCSPAMVAELGRLLVNVTSIIPEGVVVFFPSFDYENQVYTMWKDSGTLSSLEKKKVVFREPRNTASVERILQTYKQVVCSKDAVSGISKSGALLFCVVGGKMSEGINFSDGMGRCVVMVGLPYPSRSDPELVERMNYIDQLSGSKDSKGFQPRGHTGRQYYENLCMKAVNQSIGRAIRHIGDYAAILLIDVRYTSSSTPTSEHGKEFSKPSSKLPGWIKESLISNIVSYGEVQKHLKQFFKHKQLGNSLQS